MDDPADIRLRETKAFLSFVAGIEETEGEDYERALDARSYHILADYTNDDFSSLSDALLDADATGSVAFLGRDVDEQAPAIEAVDDAGHEVTLHGHRHVSFGDLSYDTAYDDLSTGMGAIEDASGVTPTGFFAPFKGVSDGTLEAAADLGIDWVLGAPEGDIPDGLPIVDSVYPHDSRLLEGGTPPDRTFDRLAAEAEEGATFLFHPNLIEYYGATDAFVAWLSDVDPVRSVGEQLEDGGVGIVLDCLRPLRLV